MSVHFLHIILICSLFLPVISKGQIIEDQRIHNKKLLLKGHPDDSIRRKIQKEIEEKKKLPPKKLRKVAVLAEKKGDFYNAIDFYEIYLSKRPDDLKALHDLGMLYVSVRDYKKSVHTLNKLYEQDSLKYPIAQYYYAKSLKENGKYEEAKEHFTRFRKRIRGHKDDKIWKKKAAFQIQSCDFAIIENVPKEIEIGTLDSTINEEYSDFAPVYINDSTMIYSSLKANGFLEISHRFSIQVLKYTNIYETRWRDSNWQNIGVFSPIDKKEWLGKLEPANGVMSIDGSRFYFSLCERNKDGVRCDICYVEKNDDDEWGEVIKLPSHINDPKYTNTQPAISTESKRGSEVLYFVSNREDGSRGGMDIWYSVRHHKTGEFKKVKNAGRTVNTPGDEITPYFDNNNKRLYFASDLLPGYGGFDIFSTVGEMKKWEDIENIGLPFNTMHDDLYYMQNSDGEKGFVVSNREGSIALKHEGCCDDIFSFKRLHIIKIKISGGVKGEEGESLQNAIAALYLINNTGEELLLKTKMLDSLHRYSFNVEVDKQYKVVIQNDGYLNNAIEFSTDTFTRSGSADVRTVELNKPNKPLRLDNIQYETGSYDLSESVKQNLDTTLLWLIEANPSIIVEISSHTDNVGTAEFNMKLSKKRAQKVIDYLVDKGIDKKRLKYKGYGETLPIATNDTEEGRAKNRRTEFRVLGEVKERSSSKKKKSDEDED